MAASPPLSTTPIDRLTDTASFVRYGRIIIRLVLGPSLRAASNLSAIACLGSIGGMAEQPPHGKDPSLYESVKRRLKENVSKSFAPVDRAVNYYLPALGREFREDPWGTVKGVGLEMARAQVGLGERDPSVPDQAQADFDRMRTHPEEGAFAQMAMPINVKGPLWRQDNPFVERPSDYTKEWLQNNQNTPTAYFRDVHDVPVDLIRGVPGERGEHLRFSTPEAQAKIASLVESMKANGFDPESPISLQIRPDGKPVIYEGNHRAQAALAAGLDRVPVEVKYLGGGEELARGSRYSLKNVEAAIRSLLENEK